MISLTPRQQDVLRFIIGFQEANDGISPTFKEIGAAIGLSSMASVSRHLDEIARRGALRRLTARPRAIEVLVRLPIPRSPNGEPLYCVRAEGLVA
jgi:SOS-response transcriptional repressor LexA